MIVLGIDTSFDDTSIAIVEDGTKILSNVIVSQMKEHEIYGGVIPERASRRHLEVINSVLSKALSEASLNQDDIDYIAVANRPGLLGSLLIGIMCAKALAFSLNKPLIGIHHIEAHIYSNFLAFPELDFPQVCLVVSGGHSSLIKVEKHLSFELLGATTDDASGEVFDKVARYLKLGFPGGPIIDKLAKEGNPKAINFPRPRINENTFNFSFSGLKTAVIRYVEKHPEVDVKDVAASFQQAVVDVLVDKTVNAALRYDIKNVSLSGGVAANDGLRTGFTERCEAEGLKFFCPPKKLCTDNAAMISSLGYFRAREGERSDYMLDAVANAPI